MGDASTWGLIWLAVATAFGVGEIVLAGSFFLAPFAVGALVAAIAGFAGAPVWASWTVFALVSVLAFLGLRPIAKRMDQSIPNPIGIGANRLIGSHGVVLADTASGGAGLVRVGAEDWKAESVDGSVLVTGQDVEVTEVRGTRVVVRPIS